MYTQVSDEHPPLFFWGFLIPLIFILPPVYNDTISHKIKRIQFEEILENVDVWVQFKHVGPIWGKQEFSQNRHMYQFTAIIPCNISEKEIYSKSNNPAIRFQSEQTN